MVSQGFLCPAAPPSGPPLPPDGTERRYGPPGSALTAVLRVLDWRFFPKLAAGSDIALGEAFMAGVNTPPSTREERKERERAPTRRNGK